MKKHEVWAETQLPQAQKELVLSKGLAFLNDPPIWLKKNHAMSSPEDECTQNARVEYFIENNRVSDSYSIANCGGLETSESEIRIGSTLEGMPFVRFSPKKSELDGETAILYLPGGPYAGVSTNLDRDYLLRNIIIKNSRTSSIFIPQYLGTDRIIVGESPGLYQAQIEIEKMVKKLASDFKSVCIVGASLGGYIMAGIDISLNNVNYLAISPLLISPSEFQIRQKVQFEARERSEGAIDFLNLEGARNGAADGVMGPLFIKSQYKAEFRRYFGSEFLLSFEDRLRQFPKDLVIIIDPKDAQIGGEKAETFGNLTDIKFIDSGGRHDYDAAEVFPSYARLFEHELRRCISIG